MRAAKLIISVVTACSLLMLSACRDIGRYYGEHPELYTVAVNSILGLGGGESGTAIVVDEDSYGRILFAYIDSADLAGKSVNKSYYTCAFLVVQQTDEGYVYYYPDYNFLALEWVYGSPNESYGARVERVIQENNLDDQLQELQDRNDWGKPLAIEKCVKYRVSIYERNKEEGYDLVSDEAKQVALKQVAGRHDIVNTKYHFNYLTSDQSNRHIFTFRTMVENGTYTGSYVVMFNEDGSFDPHTGIMKIEDPWNYQDELVEFKKKNGWETPFASL